MGLPGGLAVKNLPAMQEMRFQSLGREDPLEKEMTTHSRILAWRIPWTEDLWQASKETDRTVQLNNNHKIYECQLSGGKSR